MFVGVLVIWISQQTQKTPIVDDVLLENVEALANTEFSEPIICRWDGDVVCPISNRKSGIVYIGYSLR